MLSGYLVMLGAGLIPLIGPIGAVATILVGAAAAATGH